MRILIWSSFPGSPNGYGKQTGYLAPWLAAQGHQVAISASYGLHGSPTTWRDIPVYPGGLDPWGNDVVVGHYRHWNAGLLLSLLDTWTIDPGALDGQHLAMAFQTPVDCDPLGAGDEAVLLRTHALPLAISGHGQKMMEAAGLHPELVPHGIDTEVFTPSGDRAALREQMGLAGRFVIGLNAANSDGTRKAYSEQFQAFARFRARHPEALLLVHAIDNNTCYGGIDLRALAARLGITADVKFCDQTSLKAGLFPDEALAAWYEALDVLSNASRGEGYGLAVAEAMACGTPVVVTACSAMPETGGPLALKVGGQRVWHDLHKAFWVSPDVEQLDAAYEKVWKAPARKRRQAREWALRWDWRRVFPAHWPAVLERFG